MANRWRIEELTTEGWTLIDNDAQQLTKALCDEKRNNIYPQFTDHYFTGEYPIKPIDQIKSNKITQLSLLSGKSTN